MQQKITTEIRKTLEDCADEQKRKTSAQFYKSGEAAQVYGVGISEVRKIGKEFYKQIKDYSKQELFSVCEELWKSKYLEEAVIACIFTESLEEKYEPTDFQIFEHWIQNYVNNWADCDTFCNHTVGTFIMKFPNYVHKLKHWAQAQSAFGKHTEEEFCASKSARWLKRASAVSLIIPARKGMFLNEILEIAEILLLDKDDLVQKGYGWMLKAASMTEKSALGKEQTKAKHLEAVFDFIMKHKEVMPRTALRYAIEKMPPDMKAKAMAK